MRKFLLSIVTILLICSLSYSVFASEPAVTVSDHNIIVSKTVDKITVISEVPIILINGLKHVPLRTLSNVFEGEISWDNNTKSILITHNDNQMMFKNTSNNVYINGHLMIYDYPVTIIDGVSYAHVDVYKLFTGEYLDNVVVEEIEEINDQITIESGYLSDKIILSGSFDIDKTYLLTNPNRLVIDFKDFKPELSNLTGETFTAIRTSTSDENIFKMVFDLNNEYKYSIYQEKGSVIIVVSSDGSFITEVKPFEIENNVITLLTSNYINYHVERLSDPFRIIIDIPSNIVIGLHEEVFNSGNITSIKSYPYEDGTRYEIASDFQCSFDLIKGEKLSIVVNEPVVTGINYYNYGDRKYITVNGLLLANRSDSDIKYYTYDLSKDGLTYKITFTDSSYKINSGQLYINDDYISSIFVDRHKEKITITIEGKQSFIYYVNGEDRNSHINILPKTDETFVVIDPGHGGFDPGAINGKIYESNINLDISLKLEKQLNELGIKTFMLRETDEFIGVYERAELANLLNGTLFVSVHINALEDSDFSGIMTLAYPGVPNYDYPNGQLLASFIQSGIISSTDATDLGIIDRDKLVVLKDTNMPSVLVECGFITNEDELSNMLQPDYQNLIANGIANGILETLNYVR